MNWQRKCIGIRNLPINIFQDLVEANASSIKGYEEMSDEEIEAIVKKVGVLTPAEAFDMWLNYEGIINYGPKLRNLFDKLEELTA